MGADLERHDTGVDNPKVSHVVDLEFTIHHTYAHL